MDQEPRLEDLKEVDLYRYNLLNQVLTQTVLDSDLFYAADLGSGTEVELCENGSNLQVTEANKA